MTRPSIRSLPGGADFAACPHPEKSRFYDKARAKRAALHARKKIGHRLKPYRCVCGGWHLTSVD